MFGFRWFLWNFVSTRIFESNIELHFSTYFELNLTHNTHNLYSRVKNLPNHCSPLTKSRSAADLTSLSQVTASSLLLCVVQFVDFNLPTTPFSSTVQQTRLPILRISTFEINLLAQHTQHSSSPLDSKTKREKKNSARQEVRWKIQFRISISST